MATLAATFSAEWGDTLWAGLAGASMTWEGPARLPATHLPRPDAHIEGRVPGAEKTHSAAGGLHARSEFGRLLDARSADNSPARPAIPDRRPSTRALPTGSRDGHSGLAPRLASAAARTEYDEAPRAWLKLRRPAPRA